MGIGSSGMEHEYRQKRRYPPSKYGNHGRKKHRRGLLRRPRPRTPPQTVPHAVPIQQHSYNRYAYGYGYGSYPYVQPAPVYAPMSQPQAYSGYMPMYNNNYHPTGPYAFSRQPVMVPQHISQPMAAPSQVPLYQPGVMPQQVPISQPTPMTRQVPLSMFSPYIYPPSAAAAAYPTGVPYSVPNVQPQAQAVYNNVVSTPSFSPTGSFASPNFAASNSFRLTTGRLSTDWTGGGKISPGFLGPPI